MLIDILFFDFFVFPLVSMFFDRFRLNGYRHVFPLIEIYRFIQLPSRTDDINFILDVCLILIDKNRSIKSCLIDRTIGEIDLF